MKYLVILLLIIMIGCQTKGGNLSLLYVDPVFQVDQRAPTEDKPQSKIWFAHDTWWALLPKATGPSLWKRTSSGWLEEEQISHLLVGEPAKADVYDDGNGNVMAVLVGNCQLKILRLSYSDSANRYELKPLSSLQIPGDCGSMETATIAKDKQGVWWVASDVDLNVVVWSSPDGIHWSEPKVLATNISEDDICTIAELPEGISVIWSNQNNEAIMEVFHKDSDPVDRWSEPIVVEQGNKTADDHLNTTLLEDGTLVLVTKNSLDEIDKPQFVLRIRNSDGRWENKGFANLTSQEMPTRPVVTHTPSGTLIGAYAVRNVNLKDYHISIMMMNEQQGHWQFKENILFKARNNSTVNNVSVGKKPFPKSAPWIILFSDVEGNVYEVDLQEHRSLFN